jgi:hypothetical protein
MSDPAANEARTMPQTVHSLNFQRSSAASALGTSKCSNPCIDLVHLQTHRDRGVVPFDTYPLDAINNYAEDLCPRSPFSVHLFSNGYLT